MLNIGFPVYMGLSTSNVQIDIHSIFQTLGTAACPPYHLAFVVGGTSAEFNLKTVKMASCKYLDGLPTEGKLHEPYLMICSDASGHNLTGIASQFATYFYPNCDRKVHLHRKPATHHCFAFYSSTILSTEIADHFWKELNAWIMGMSITNL